MQNFRNLIVWEKSMELVEMIYRKFSEFPGEQKYVLKPQLSRAAISTPSNIAEGCGYDSSKQFRNYLQHALGSSYEVETQLILVQRLHQTDVTDLIAQTKQVQKMLQSLIKKVRTS
ncbi:MAG: four helix bundle protein [Bacteroidota bacterium]